MARFEKREEANSLTARNAKRFAFIPDLTFVTAKEKQNRLVNDVGVSSERNQELPRVSFLAIHL